MINQDTIHLLKECDAGTKMAVSSIEDVTEKISDNELKQLLNESKQHHEKIGNEIHLFLLENLCEQKDPTPVAKGMSWLKTNVKLAIDDSVSTAADLLIDGCNMGVKTLFRYLNQYKAADSIAKDICNRLISIEEKLGKDLRCYL